MDTWKLLETQLATGVMKGIVLLVSTPESVLAGLHREIRPAAREVHYTCTSTSMTHSNSYMILLSTTRCWLSVKRTSSRCFISFGGCSGKHKDVIGLCMFKQYGRVFLQTVSVRSTFAKQTTYLLVLLAATARGLAVRRGQRVVTWVLTHLADALSRVPLTDVGEELKGNETQGQVENKWWVWSCFKDVFFGVLFLFGVMLERVDLAIAAALVKI